MAIGSQHTLFPSNVEGSVVGTHGSFKLLFEHQTFTTMFIGVVFIF